LLEETCPQGYLLKRIPGGADEHAHAGHAIHPIAVGAPSAPAHIHVVKDTLLPHESACGQAVVCIPNGACHGPTSADPHRDRPARIRATESCDVGEVEPLDSVLVIPDEPVIDAGRTAYLRLQVETHEVAVIVDTVNRGAGRARHMQFREHAVHDLEPSRAAGGHLRIGYHLRQANGSRWPVKSHDLAVIIDTPDLRFQGIRDVDSHNAPRILSETGQD